MKETGVLRRLDGEPDMWFGRFTQFVLLGPDRSVLQTYNRQRHTEGKSAAKRSPSSWDEAAKRWKWRERAAAWDEAQRAALMQQEREATKAMLHEHLQAARAVRLKALQYILKGVKDDKPIEFSTMEGAVRALETAVTLERKTRGLPDYMVDILGMDDATLIREFQKTAGAILGFNLDEGPEPFEPAPPPASIDDG